MQVHAFLPCRKVDMTEGLIELCSDLYVTRFPVDVDFMVLTIMRFRAGETPSESAPHLRTTILGGRRPVQFPDRRLGDDVHQEQDLGTSIVTLRFPSLAHAAIFLVELVSDDRVTHWWKLSVQREEGQASTPLDSKE